MVKRVLDPKGRQLSTAVPEIGRPNGVPLPSPLGLWGPAPLGAEEAPVGPHTPQQDSAEVLDLLVVVPVAAVEAVVHLVV